MVCFVYSTMIRDVKASSVTRALLGLAFVLIPLVRGAKIDFETQVQPILEQNCYKCHGPDKQKGGLRLDSKESAFKESDSGEKALIPGNSARSKLFQLITSTDSSERMPSKGDPLSSDKIAILKSWIDEGAVWPDASKPAIAVLKRDHWSFQPIVRRSPPKTANKEWPRNPIDHFILAKLEQNGMTPAPEADRATLLRRLSFDVRGLPPTIAELSEFLADESSSAYERFVERFLNSPQYGERWAQHWLDVVRYAESEGFEYDNDIPDMWRFRDYVMTCF